MAHPKDLDPYASPRAFYGAELRLKREEAGLSQDRLGERLYCSGAYIGQLEAATRRPQLDMAKQLDEIFGTGEHFSRLCRMVHKVSRHAEKFEAAAELEAMARSICEYASMFVPGLLQTAAYARAVFRAAQPVARAERIEELIAARTGRAAKLEDPTEPLLWFVLDENVIRRPVGGPAVMREQLGRIVDLARRERVIVQVLPFSCGVPALNGMTTLMAFDDAPPVAYAEGPQTGNLIEDPALVAKVQLSYDLVRAAALPQKASLALIESAMEDFAPCVPPSTT
ncbi:helix-turn-helix transcriptional regulator [Streptomyces sp. NBC_01537]|uniref:helix-turn-helix domain-containing protein n=1 Tax=Streptomyces sp. NBC_01537 TaxID=2903896 RepID=UPI003865B124